MLQLESLMHPNYGCALDCHFVAAGILPAATAQDDGSVDAPSRLCAAEEILTERGNPLTLSARSLIAIGQDVT